MADRGWGSSPHRDSPRPRRRETAAGKLQPGGGCSPKAFQSQRLQSSFRLSLSLQILRANLHMFKHGPYNEGVYTSHRISQCPLNQLARESPVPRYALRREICAIPRTTAQISLIHGMFGSCLLFWFQQKCSRKYILASLEKDLDSDLWPSPLLCLSAAWVPQASDDDNNERLILWLEAHKASLNSIPSHPASIFFLPPESLHRLISWLKRILHLIFTLTARDALSGRLSLGVTTSGILWKP